MTREFPVTNDQRNPREHGPTPRGHGHLDRQISRSPWSGFATVPVLQWSDQVDNRLGRVAGLYPGHWSLLVGHFTRWLWLALMPLVLCGCRDAAAQREDRRILTEFRGPHFLPVSERRPSPAGPPLVPHVVYQENFDCLVCHGNPEFHFRGQWVPVCTHPERTACLQCHVPWQTNEQPFRVQTLGRGPALATARDSPSATREREKQP